MMIKRLYVQFDEIEDVLASIAIDHFHGTPRLPKGSPFVIVRLVRFSLNIFLFSMIA